MQTNGTQPHYSRPPVERVYLAPGERLSVTADQLADGEFMHRNHDVVALASSEGRLDLITETEAPSAGAGDFPEGGEA